MKMIYKRSYTSREKLRNYIRFYSELTTVLVGIQFESQWNDTNTRASDLSEVKSEHVK